MARRHTLAQGKQTRPFSLKRRRVFASTCNSLLEVSHTTPISRDFGSWLLVLLFNLLNSYFLEGWVGGGRLTSHYQKKVQKDEYVP